MAALASVAYAKGPRLASMEELIEQADAYLQDFDDDEDGMLSSSELVPVMDAMRVGSSASMEQSAQLTPTVFMGMVDADKDGSASRGELIDLFLRMKGYDAGRLERSEASTPQAGTSSKTGPGYAESHSERMQKKKKKKKKKALPKDEM